MTRLAPVIAAVAFVAGVVLPPAGDVTVTPVVSEGRVLASMAAPDAWTVETRELLQIGQLLTFSYDIELRRPSTIWLDSLVARTSISTSAKFDTLTGGYQVSRLRDGRVIRSERREQESEVRQWMTVVEQVQLDPEIAAGTQRGVLHPRADVHESAPHRHGVALRAERELRPRRLHLHSVTARVHVQEFARRRPAPS